VDYHLQKLVQPVKVLFLTIGNVDSISAHGIYTDLMREFRDRGHDVYIACALERRHGRSTELVVEDGISVLRVRTGNITRTGVVEKGISTILLEFQFTAAIGEYLGHVRFDLVLYSTPPITFERVVKHVKRRDGCRSYLMLRDIFPQNAVDLAMMRAGSLIWRYFRSKEKRLYAASDYIGCMSQANVAYLLTHDQEISPTKVEECPNCIKPNPLRGLEETHPEVRDAHGIPRDAVVLIYGGNLGRPQGLGFLLDVLDRAKDREGIFFLIVGSGTEYGRIETHLRSGRHRNARLLAALPRDEYGALLADCDVGLVFLDPRFTIPNFPSRLTAYMESAIPIIAATDSNTDIRDVLLESSSGIWVESGDLDGFMAAVERLAADAALRREMGLRGRAYLEMHYTVSRAYDIISAHFTD
jgi:glycosyltransferase involved in cell wall biosynthesis